MKYNGTVIKREKSNKKGYLYFGIEVSSPRNNSPTTIDAIIKKPIKSPVGPPITKDNIIMQR